MKIIHFTYNTTGGAGKVAVQLHNLFLQKGTNSVLINTETNDPKEKIYTIPVLNTPVRKFFVKLHYYIFRVYVRFRYKKKKKYGFNYNYNYRGLTFKEIKQAIPFHPDIIFLHWIADFILPKHLSQLQKYYQCPIIWRYNDLAPLTGGCHYPNTCKNYQSECKRCPAIGSKKIKDHANKQWHLKMKVFESMRLLIINTTKETENVFKTSPLYIRKQQKFIRNSVNTKVFNDSDRNEARKLLNLKETTKVIFWGATHITEDRKGFNFFVEALNSLDISLFEDVLVLIGGIKPSGFTPNISVPHTYTGLLSLSQLILHYKASDVLVVSSTEDAGPMMIVEGMLCGTPVVSFATGLANELVISGQTGYKAEVADPADLKKGIHYVLNLPKQGAGEMKTNCIQLTRQLYGEETEWQLYQALFEELAQSKK